MVSLVAERVMTTDPRRWPQTPPNFQSILRQIHGHPDPYAEETYGTITLNNILARESARFIGEHVMSEQRVISQILQESDPGTRSIIDLGSRDGRLYSELIKPGIRRGIQFKNYFGIDMDEKAIAFLKKRLAYDSTAHAILGDITKLDEVLNNVDANLGKSTIQSPVVCILQNTLGTINGKGNWEQVVFQVKQLLDRYPRAEIVLSLYKSINPFLTVEEIGEALKTIEKFSGQNSKEALLRVKNAVQLLGNGWLLPSYLYTKAHNGWPPNAAKLAEKTLCIPETGYVSRQWSNEDIASILKGLGAKEIERQEGKEFVVLRLGKN